MFKCLKEGRYQYGVVLLCCIGDVIDMIEEHQSCLMQHFTSNKTSPVYQYREKEHFIL